MAPEWQLPHWLPGLRAEEGHVSPVNQQACAPRLQRALPPPRPLKPSYFWGRGRRDCAWEGGGWGRALENRVLWHLQLLRGKCY